MESVYDLYQRGCELLDHGDHQAAIVPLSKARDLEPDKASIREALGRALFHAQRYEGAA
jgi:TolA-binding protein